MNIDVRDTVVVVTGAGSGLGAAAARRFADEGARVVGFDLSDSPGSACELDVAVDVTSPEQVAASVDRVQQTYGAIDTVVNCAGIMGPLGAVQDLPVEAWRRTLEVNLGGTFLVCRAVLPGMLERRAGRIVNVASSAGVEHSAGQAAYNASKAGVISLTKTLSREVHTQGVTVNAICPGNVQTPLLQGFIDDEIESDLVVLHENQQAHAQMSESSNVWEPADVMDLVVFLASPAGSHLNGHFLRMTTKSHPGVH